MKTENRTFWSEVMSFIQSFISLNGRKIAFFARQKPPDRFEANPVYGWAVGFMEENKKSLDKGLFAGCTIVQTHMV